MVHTSITRLEDCVATLKAKEKIANSDSATIQQLLKRLDTLGGKFTTHHLAVVDLVEQETLSEEQVVPDDHNDKVLLLAEILQCLVEDAEATSPP